jgi:hypothetical protein
MTIRRSVTSLFPGKGLAGTYAFRSNVNCNVGSTTVSFPVTGTNVAPPLSNGVVRIKTATLGTNSNVNVQSVIVTDNTSGVANNVQVYNGDVGLTANSVGMDRVIDFFTDVTVQQVSVVVNVSNNTCTMDFELAGNS